MKSESNNNPMKKPRVAVRKPKHNSIPRSEEQSMEDTEEQDGTEATEKFEKLSSRESHETHVVDDIPPLAARVESLQEAVQISLQDGVTEDCLFVFSRALKAFEITTRKQLDHPGRRAAFALWWNEAGTQLPADADFEEWCFVFEDAFEKARSPLGANHLDEAIRLLDTQQLPSQALRYTSPRIQRLVGVCFHLQCLEGDAPFFLSVRDAARLAGCSSNHQSLALLNGLVRDGILDIVAKGKPGSRKATRYRFNFTPPTPNPGR